MFIAITYKNKQIIISFFILYWRQQDFGYKWINWKYRLNVIITIQLF